MNHKNLGRCKIVRYPVAKATATQLVPQHRDEIDIRDGNGLNPEKLERLAIQGGRLGVMIIWHYAEEPGALKIVPLHITQDFEGKIVYWTPDSQKPGQVRQYELHKVLGARPDTVYEEAADFNVALVAADDSNIFTVYEEVMQLVKFYQGD